MPKVLARPIGFEDRLSVVDHLGELRARLFVCLGALLVIFGVCFWQNHALLGLLNHALPADAQTSANHIGGVTQDLVGTRGHLQASGRDLLSAAGDGSISASVRALLSDAGKQLLAAASALPQSTPKRLPITIGVGEAFTTTLTVSGYFALLITLPLIIYQGYAFTIPALAPKERKVVTPIVVAAPFLFAIGVAFAYFFILPPAVKFLQGYNSANFDNLVQAKPLYSFEILTMAGIGLAFQLPLGLLGLLYGGVINGTTLTRHWRYALMIITLIAAAMPGADPVSTAFEVAPLLVLYLASIVLLKVAERRMLKRAGAIDLDAGDESDAEPVPQEELV